MCYPLGRGKVSCSTHLTFVQDRGSGLLGAHNDGASLDAVVSPGWPDLEALVATTSRLTDTLPGRLREGAK